VSVQGRLVLALGSGFGLLSVALAIGLFAVADGIRDRGAADTIAVTGSAKRKIASDFVIWEASVSAQGFDPAPAAAQLERWFDRLLAALRRSGIRDEELVVRPITTETLFGQNGETAGYNLTRALQVRSGRIDVVVAAIEGSGRLLAAGIPISAGQPQFVYTKLAELRPALSAEATKDAIVRAEAIVAVTGDELGALREVRVAPFLVTAPGSTDVSDLGIYDTSTREKEVTAVVNATFAVK
jgi:hypothetical protein